MNGLKRVLREEPTLISEAVRVTLLAVVLVGLNLSDEAVLGIVAAVGAILTLANRAVVTPTATVDATVKEQVAEQVQEHDDTRPLTAEERATLSVLRDQRDRLEAEVARPMTEIERVEASRRPQ